MVCTQSCDVQRRVPLRRTERNNDGGCRDERFTAKQSVGQEERIHRYIRPSWPRPNVLSNSTARAKEWRTGSCQKQIPHPGFQQGSERQGDQWGSGERWTDGKRVDKVIGCDFDFAKLSPVHFSGQKSGSSGQRGTNSGARPDRVHQRHVQRPSRDKFPHRV